MRLLTLAAAALTFASHGLASAQATNTSPKPGAAKSLSNSVDSKNQQDTTKSGNKPTTTGKAMDKPASPPSGSGGANQSTK
jgi:hypothetical protein